VLHHAKLPSGSQRLPLAWNTARGVGLQAAMTSKLTPEDVALLPEKQIASVTTRGSAA
jgi:hypothetical protein